MPYFIHLEHLSIEIYLQRAYARKEYHLLIGVSTEKSLDTFEDTHKHTLKCSTNRVSDLIECLNEKKINYKSLSRANECTMTAAAAAAAAATMTAHWR